MAFGTTEILIILFIVLLLFGAKKLPELARGLGQGFKEFKKDEWFFKVHWPSDPNVPGMLQIESLV